MPTLPSDRGRWILLIVEVPEDTVHEDLAIECLYPIAKAGASKDPACRLSYSVSLPSGDSKLGKASYSLYFSDPGLAEAAKPGLKEALSAARDQGRFPNCWVAHVDPDACAELYGGTSGLRIYEELDAVSGDALLSMMGEVRPLSKYPRRMELYCRMIAALTSGSFSFLDNQRRAELLSEWVESSVGFMSRRGTVIDMSSIDSASDSMEAQLRKLLPWEESVPEGWRKCLEQIETASRAVSPRIEKDLSLISSNMKAPLWFGKRVLHTVMFRLHIDMILEATLSLAVAKLMRKGLVP